MSKKETKVDSLKMKKIYHKKAIVGYMITQ